MCRAGLKWLKRVKYVILNRLLYDLFIEKAESVTIDCLSIGLGYTAVTTSDGSMGLSGTYFAGKKPASLNRGYVDPEGRRADGLLINILQEDMVKRSMAIALINALNYRNALSMPESPGNRFLLESLNPEGRKHVAMVGMFRPLIRIFEEQQMALEIFDETLNLGEKNTFYDKLSNWADILIMTSTCILNNTTEEILEHTGNHVRTMILGPGTPMMKAAFSHLPIHVLAGAVPVEKEKVQKAIRHGAGTPVIKQFCRQCFLNI